MHHSQAANESACPGTLQAHDLEGFLGYGASRLTWQVSANGALHGRGRSGSAGRRCSISGYPLAGIGSPLLMRPGTHKGIHSDLWHKGSLLRRLSGGPVQAWAPHHLTKPDISGLRVHRGRAMPLQRRGSRPERNLPACPGENLSLQGAREHASLPASFRLPTSQS